MRSPNYVKFVDYFEEQFKKIDTQSTTYLSPSETLSFTLTHARNQYKFLHFYLIFILCGIIAISSIIFYFSSSPFITQKIITGLGVGSMIGLIVYYFLLKKTHLNFTKSYFFTLLSDRIKRIKEFIDNKSLNYTEDEIINLLKSPTPLKDIKKRTAYQVYYDLSKRSTQNNDEPTSIEKLYLLHFILQDDFNFKTDNEEFNHVLGAILNLSPKSMKNNLTELNKLKAYIDNDSEKIDKDDIKLIQRNLRNIEKRRDLLFNQLKDLRNKKLIP